MGRFCKRPQRPGRGLHHCGGRNRGAAKDNRPRYAEVFDGLVAQLQGDRVYRFRQQASQVFGRIEANHRAILLEIRQHRSAGVVPRW